MKFLKKSYTYAACFGPSFDQQFWATLCSRPLFIRCHPNRKSYDYGHQGSLKAAASATTTDTSYSDDNIQVSLTEKND